MKATSKVAESIKKSKESVQQKAVFLAKKEQAPSVENPEEEFAISSIEAAAEILGLDFMDAQVTQ